MFEYHPNSNFYAYMAKIFTYMVHRTIEGVTEYLYFFDFSKALAQYRSWHSMYDGIKNIDVGISQITRLV